MSSRERSMGADATVNPKLPETMSTDAARTMPEMSTARESTKTAATATPTKSEIAAVAYQLWLDNGCPVGTDQEDWFRAEAMLKKALVANCEDLPRLPSVSSGDTQSKSEKRAELRWKGHWEVWEMEWQEAHWIWD